MKISFLGLSAITIKMSLLLKANSFVIYFLLACNSTRKNEHMSNNIIGIDPGLSGAIAIIENGDLYIHDMPVLEYDIEKGKKKRREVNVGRLFNILNSVHHPIAYLEGVAGRPGMGGTQMFAFGQSYGMIKACLTLAGIPYKIVSPQKWKRHFSLSRDKDQSRITAQQIFPDRAKKFSRKKDDGRAEAALIARYGLRNEKETLK